MKIVGLILFSFICVALMPAISFANFTCKGDVYSRLDNGELAAEKVEFIPNNFQNIASSAKSDGPFVFIGDKKSDEWTYYRKFDDKEMLYVRGYRNTVPDFYYDDMRLDRSSFIKFRDNAIIGFNLVCRM